MQEESSGKVALSFHNVDFCEFYTSQYIHRISWHFRNQLRLL